ncbi:MerR family transcriptional regulator [Paenibacillus sp. TH7-28]
MKISELSQKTGVSARSIRHYEKKNIIKAVRLDNGYREFDESAVERIRIIQLYLGLGLTTEQIENILGCEDAGPVEYSFCQEMLDLYQEKIDQVDKQINELETVKLRLGRQIEQMKERRVSAKTPLVEAAN